MHYILRFGEISLKGKNRRFFENKLKGNINKLFDVKIRKEGGRFYAEGDEGLNFRKLFGIVSYSPAEKVEKDYEEIEEEILKMAEHHQGTFAIQANRLDKDFRLTSMELNRKLGQAVVDNYGLEVDLDDPDLTIGVEISHEAAYVFKEVIDCFGGLPVGCEGEVLALIEDDKDILAALLLMKRGCDVIPFGPEKKDTSLLEEYGCTNDFRKANYEEFKDWDVPALVVGDTLKYFKEYDISLPVMRPLVGYDEEKIREMLERYREGIR